MPTCQLNVRVEVALAKRLRQAAKAQHTTPGALVAQALELLLAGNSRGPAPALSADSSALAAALAALEQRVRALEQRQAAKTQPREGGRFAGVCVAHDGEDQAQAIVAKPATGELSPKPAAAAEPLEWAITTAELAERTGTNRAAWNNWAADERIGQTRPHPQAGPWRLVGKGPGPNGGPDRWLWEAVAG